MCHHSQPTCWPHAHSFFSGDGLLDDCVRPRDPRGGTSTRAATRPHSRMGRLEGAEVAPPALAPHDLAQLRAGPETETLVGSFCLPRHPSCVDGTEVLGIAPRLHRGVKAIPSRVAIVVEGSISQVSAGAVATTTTVAAATLTTIATGGPATVAVAASTPATVVVAFPAAATAATASVAVGVASEPPQTCWTEEKTRGSGALFQACSNTGKSCAKARYHRLQSHC